MKPTKHTIYTNPCGIMFNRYDYKERSAVKVQSENGTTLMTYRMNNTPFYVNKYLSWENLDMCNGWRHDEAYTLKAICNGTKPAGSINFETQNPDEFEAAAVLSKINIPATHRFVEKDCFVYPKAYYPEGGANWIFYILPEMSINELFDMDEIKEAYLKHTWGYIEKYNVWEKVMDLANIKLTALPYDLMSPDTDAELIITGLAFGYPIESTASLILGY